MADSKYNQSKCDQDNSTISSTSEVVLSQLFQSKNSISEADRNNACPTSIQEGEHANRLTKELSPASLEKSSATVNATVNATKQHLNTNQQQENNKVESVNHCSQNATPNENNINKKHKQKLTLQIPSREQQINVSPAQAKTPQQLPHSSPACSLQTQQPHVLQNQRPHGLQNQRPHGLQNQHPHGLQNQHPHGLQNQHPHGLQNQHPHGLQNQHPHGLQNQRPHVLQNQHPHGLQNQPPHVLQNQSPYVLQNQHLHVHEFFSKFISPLYAPTNLGYLENIINHPNYKLDNRRPIEAQQHAGSLLGSPPFILGSHPASYPSSPLVMSDPNSPRYLVNALQHPLLSQSFSSVAYNNFHQGYYNYMRNYWLQNQIINQNNQQSPQNNKRKGKKSEFITFEPYFSLEQIEKGLKDNSLIEGVIRINPKQYQHAYISNIDKSEQDIFIDGIQNRNRALEGDVVVVQILPQESDSEDNKDMMNKRGKVVYIKEIVHKRTCIGTLKLMADMNRQKALFIPRDNRIPRLCIPFTSWPNNFYTEAARYENVLFLASIEEWNQSKFANGKIISQIGLAGDMNVERNAILAETDLDVTPFGPEYRHLYPRLDYKISEEEIAIREDCRQMCIFSIDPFNCRDIDDAVSCRKLDNGNYEVGVHISDVSHFLTESTKLDEKVAERATTIYLVEKAYHMLPDDLCMLCSLFPGVDKLAFSVFWEMTEDAKVVSHRFSKTVINSCCQLAYEHAQAVLDEKENAEGFFPEFYNGFKYTEVCETIKILGRLSLILKRNRYDTGALRINQPKLQFALNPINGMPESYKIYESKESHQLIEEFMLLANMTVADRITDDHSDIAFLRCHPPPSPYMLQQLAISLRPIGIDLNISSAGKLYRSMLPHVNPESTDIGKVMVLNMLCAKPMNRAKYFCAGDANVQDFHHYALNIPLYTHFTSPIRRYADIMVHRLLSASLKYRDVPNWDIKYVKQVAAQCNRQKFNAKKAGELSNELYLLKYIEMHLPMITEAAVVEVREKYIDLIIIAMYLNKRLFFNSDFPGKYERITNEAGTRLSKMQVTWNATKELPSVVQLIEVFSVVKVELYRDDEMARVGIRLIRPE